MNIQAFDINAYVLQYVPPFLRYPKLIGYLQALLAPLVSYRYRLLTSIYPTLERRARYNSQVIVFEALLNYELGYVSQEITILDGTIVGQIYTANADENAPIYTANASELDPVYIGNAAEYDPQFDFIVRAPQQLVSTQLVRLKSLVNKYKMVGTVYTVVAY
ncbi:hypothetical protein E4631_24075 [Hymenobacter sp. UV11]|uniref:hypothetical protein n=1 Tax=Hymenobacter sp. UV11 TaxID=1849735 RepID=UPI00105F7150|nr:hypothetical protein [Hymenobacter sp. UV11]TDN38603.1 hypothetical protein A8B98_22930 [Hymenobacter sp. UV11]TFZ63009.1 hypothetical protein E4631_24075 [Hymenobacter sp. UV11]